MHIGCDFSHLVASGRRPASWLPSRNGLTAAKEIDAIKEARPNLVGCIFCATEGRGVLVANALHADRVPQQDTRRLPTVVVLTALGASPRSGIGGDLK
jgi:hypothetical protein